MCVLIEEGGTEKTKIIGPLVSQQVEFNSTKTNRN
jgi:hypothetical protein